MKETGMVDKLLLKHKQQFPHICISIAIAIPVLGMH